MQWKNHHQSDKTHRCYKHDLFQSFAITKSSGLKFRWTPARLNIICSKQLKTSGDMHNHQYIIFTIIVSIRLSKAIDVYAICTIQYFRLLTNPYMKPNFLICLKLFPIKVHHKCDARLTGYLTWISETLIGAVRSGDKVSGCGGSGSNPQILRFSLDTKYAYIGLIFSRDNIDMLWCESEGTEFGTKGIDPI